MIFIFFFFYSEFELNKHNSSKKNYINKIMYIKYNFCVVKNKKLK